MRVPPLPCPARACLLLPACQVRCTALTALVEVLELVVPDVRRTRVIPVLKSHLQPLELDLTVQKCLGSHFGQIMMGVRGAGGGSWAGSGLCVRVCVCVCVPYTLAPTPRPSHWLEMARPACRSLTHQVRAAGSTGGSCSWMDAQSPHPKPLPHATLNPFLTQSP